jgi:23S rRNA (uracil1939-C5)-methyltransferase
MYLFAQLLNYATKPMFVIMCYSISLFGDVLIMNTKANIILEATIEKFSHDGRGIARIDGKTTFIQGALPDEAVTFKYLKRKKSYDEGQIISVEKPSQHRVHALCSHFETCGGCALQHLHAVIQIEEKQSLFLDMLARIGHCTPEEVLPPLVGPLWHYRQKARLSVRYHVAKNHVFLGFRERNFPRFITDISHCPILNTRVHEQLDTIRELIVSLDEPAIIPQVEIAAGDDQVALIFRHMEPLSQQDTIKLIAFGKQTQFIIFLQPGGPQTVSLFYPNRDGVREGQLDDEFLTYQLPSENITFKFYPTDFTQINAGLNRLMVPHALQLLELRHDDVVMDLYCGLGNFSLPIAKHCHHVIGVEGSETMVERARMNAELNHLSNLTFFSANLENSDELKFLSQHPITKLLLDPPRAGAYEIVKRIETIHPERIVYVSCNPATLARDADILVNEKGYRLIKAGVMDMFPHTTHVESIALFVKK